METRNRRRRRERPPLDEAALREMAVVYVARFATSKARLATYLLRKVRERGWEGAAEPDLASIAERMADLGFVDDRAFAEGRARSFGARGLGARRLNQALLAAGIAEADRAGAAEIADGQAVEAALRFARRRRIGPFGLAASTDQRSFEKGFAAMIRAGHSASLAKAIMAIGSESDIDLDDLENKVR